MNKEVITKEHPLTPEQLYKVDYQLYTPKSTIYNLFQMIKVDLSIYDMNRLAKSLELAIKNHPALLTAFSFDKDGNMVQRYDESLFENIEVEHITEFEFSKIKDDLVVPFKLIDSRMYRCRVFETERSGYIFIDVHHSLFDGASFKVFMENVLRAYKNIELKEDHYYSILEQREKEESTEFYEEAKNYFEEKYDYDNWTVVPKIDNETKDSEIGELLSNLEISDSDMKEVENNFNINRNEFFITAALLSISFYNYKDNVMISWVYDGREDEKTSNSVGLLYKDLPVALKLDNKRTLKDLYKDVHKQVKNDIKYSCYSYVDKTSSVAEDDTVYLLYQQDNSFNCKGMETINIRQNQAASQTILDIQMLDSEKGLDAIINYASSKYKHESIEKFKDLFINIVHTMIKNKGQGDVTVQSIRNEVMSGENIIKKFVSIFTRKI